MIRAPRKDDPRFAVSAWTTNSIASRFLVARLDEAGRSPDDLLQRAGLHREMLASPETAMPLPVFRELWTRAAEVQPDIGLTLVDRFPAGQMHMLAHLALRSATVGAALADVSRHATVTSAADQLTVASSAGDAGFLYACRLPDHDNPWFAEHYLAMTASFLARATGRPLPIREVHFRSPALAPAAAYRQRFAVDPVFGSDHNGLHFDAAVLDWPLQTHDAYLHAILERVAQGRHSAAPDSLLDEVRRAIATRFLEGGTPTLDGIAALAKLTPRGLRQRLAQFDTTFRQLQDDVRRDLARDHLARGLSVTETAYLLGFSEPAAFQHACRRWFGHAAGEMRPRSRIAAPPGAC